MQLLNGITLKHENPENPDPVVICWIHSPEVKLKWLKSVNPSRFLHQSEAKGSNLKLEDLIICKNILVIFA